MTFFRRGAEGRGYPRLLVHAIFHVKLLADRGKTALWGHPLAPLSRFAASCSRLPPGLQMHSRIHASCLTVKSLESWVWDVGCSIRGAKDAGKNKDKLRPHIEPWLAALFQSEHLALLVGSGTSHAIHRMATGNALPEMDLGEFKNFNDEIDAAATASAEAAGRNSGNVEDQINVAN